MPNNWKTYKLGDIANIGSSKRIFRADYVDTGIPFYRSKEIIQKSFGQEIDEILYIDEEKYIKIKEKFGAPKSGDILLSAVGNRSGIPYLVNNDGEFYFKDGNLMWFRDFQNYVDSSFLVYWFKSSVGQHYLNSTMIGSAQKALTIESVKNIEVPVPNLKEQKAIANILSAIDDKIENNLAINKTLEDMAMALYKHWFVDFGPFQDGEFIDSELGPIPKGWEVKRLGDLIEVISGYAFKSKWFQDFGEKVVKIKNISNNVVDINNCNCISTEKALEINDKFKIEPGDFLVAMTGAEVGKVGVVPDYQQPLWLNQRVGKLKDRLFVNSSILVGKILQSKEYYEVIQGLAYGSAQPNISASGIENIEICLPNNLEDIQVLIDEFARSQNQIIHNLTENESLTKLRDTILPKLISGEVRLKEFQEQIESVL